MTDPNSSPFTTLGILGGGQLARMTAYAAFRLGMRVHVFEKFPDSPAGQIAHRQTVGDVADHDALLRFAAECDVVTLESEFVNEKHLRAIEDAGLRLYPGAGSVARIQDKLAQKRTFRDAGIPVAGFAAADSVADAKAFGQAHGYAFLLKRRRGSYDGYGNATASDPEDVERAWNRLTDGGGESGLYCEAFVPFVKELAVMIARRRGGEVVVYPVVETVQVDHICHLVSAPAEVGAAAAESARRQARAAVESIGGVGVFGVELFLTDGGGVLLNEIAPRPHNSGHYTIEGCVTSQFENHIRAVMDLPLGSPLLRAPAVVMVNILGRADSDTGAVADYGQILRHPNAHLHIYGKAESRKGRKMGHVTVLAATVQEAARIAGEAEKAVKFRQLSPKD